MVTGRVVGAHIAMGRSQALRTVAKLIVVGSIFGGRAVSRDGIEQRGVYLKKKRNFMF